MSALALATPTAAKVSGNMPPSLKMLDIGA